MTANVEYRWKPIEPQEMAREIGQNNAKNLQDFSLSSNVGAKTIANPLNQKCSR